MISDSEALPFISNRRRKCGIGFRVKDQPIRFQAMPVMFQKTGPNNGIGYNLVRLIVYGEITKIEWIIVNIDNGLYVKMMWTKSVLGSVT
jgi:hypothetical protein